MTKYILLIFINKKEEITNLEGVGVWKELEGGGWE